MKSQKLFLTSFFLFLLISCSDPELNYNEQVFYFTEINGFLLYKGEPFDGKTLEYYPNGQLKVKASYKKGQKHGMYVSHFENGKEKERGEFFYGNKSGEWKGFFENGNIKNQYFYSSNDEIISLVKVFKKYENGKIFFEGKDIREDGIEQAIQDMPRPNTYVPSFQDFQELYDDEGAKDLGNGIFQHSDGTKYKWDPNNNWYEPQLKNSTKRKMSYSCIKCTDKRSQRPLHPSDCNDTTIGMGRNTIDITGKVNMVVRCDKYDLNEVARDINEVLQNQTGDRLRSSDLKDYKGMIRISATILDPQFTDSKDAVYENYKDVKLYTMKIKDEWYMGKSPINLNLKLPQDFVRSKLF